MVTGGPSAATGQNVFRYDPTVETDTPSWEEITLNAKGVDTTAVDGQYYMYGVEHTKANAAGDGVDVLATTNTVVMKAGSDGRPGYVWDLQLLSDTNTESVWDPYLATADATDWILAQWTAPQKNAGALGFYEVRRRESSPRGEWETLNIQTGPSYPDLSAEVDKFYDYEIWGWDFLAQKSLLRSFIQKEKVYTVPTCKTDYYDGRLEVSKFDGTNPISGFLVQSGSWLSPDYRQEDSAGNFVVNPHAVQGIMLGMFDGEPERQFGVRTPPCEGDIDLSEFEVERQLLHKFVRHESCEDQAGCFLVGGNSGVTSDPEIVEVTASDLVAERRFVFIMADPEYPEPGRYHYGYRVCTTASGDDKVCSAQLVAPVINHRYP